MDLLNLSIRIFSDTIPKEFHTYCFAHNIETLDSIIETLIENKISEIIILENKKELSGVSDYIKTNIKYTSRGIKTTNIKFDDDMINTRNESEYVIKWCHENNIKNLLLISPVFHTLRSTMTFISTMIDLNINLNIFVLPSKINWSKKYITHQGLSNEFSQKLVESENQRIQKYTLKGDIKEPKVILNYFNSRKI